MAADILNPAAAGAFFGAVLTASRVYLPSVIINQMKLRDFHMLEVFLTGSAASALAIFIIERLKLAKRVIRPNSSLNWFSPYDGNIVGGALVGVGMSLTGACPGTVLVQLAQGMPSSRATTLGSIIGGIIYARFGKSMAVATKERRDKGKDNDGCDTLYPSGKSEEQTSATIATKFSVNQNTIFLWFELACLFVVAASNLLLPGKQETIIPTIFGGLLIGVSQAISIVLASYPVGVSTAYEQLGQHINHSLGFHRNVAKPSYPPKSLLFAVGIVIGSFCLPHSSFLNPIHPQPSSSSTRELPIMQIPTIQAVLGGFILIFGSRIAGGCTSGHGLSGLGALSFSSLVTVMSMFGAGIATQGLWPLLNVAH